MKKGQLIISSTHKEGIIYDIDDKKIYVYFADKHYDSYVQNGYIVRGLYTNFSATLKEVIDKRLFTPFFNDKTIEEGTSIYLNQNKNQIQTITDLENLKTIKVKNQTGLDYLVFISLNRNILQTKCSCDNPNCKHIYASFLSLLEDKESAVDEKYAKINKIIDIFNELEKQENIYQYYVSLDKYKNEIKKIDDINDVVDLILDKYPSIHRYQKTYDIFIDYAIKDENTYNSFLNAIKYSKNDNRALKSLFMSKMQTRLNQMSDYVNSFSYNKNQLSHLIVNDQYDYILNVIYNRFTSNHELTIDEMVFSIYYKNMTVNDDFVNYVELYIQKHDHFYHVNKEELYAYIKEKGYKKEITPEKVLIMYQDIVYSNNNQKTISLFINNYEFFKDNGYTKKILEKISKVVAATNRINERKRILEAVKYITNGNEIVQKYFENLMSFGRIYDYD